MPFVTAAVIIVGVLCAVDLLLTYGVIRRLREHTRRLAALGTGGIASLTLTKGSTIHPFSATDRTAAALSRATFTEQTLVGFFTPGCTPCEDLLPGFLSAAGRWRDLSHPVLAVVAPAPGDDGTYAERLALVARVVVGEDASAVAAAFEVRGFPVVCLVGDGGVVVEDTVDLERLAEPVRV
jgi:thiol-disulfide isomerase/thioredoxin